jgi:transcriptional regulator with XRE-family HTH domain
MSNIDFRSEEEPVGLNPSEADLVADELPVTARPQEVSVGDRLRDVRRARRRTLHQVAEAAGISDSFLSQVERGTASASIASLKRIATVLGVSLGDLFQDADNDTVHVARASARTALAFEAFGKKYHLDGKPDRSFDVFICEIDAGKSTGEEPYTHGDSEELAYVIDGAVTIEVNNVAIQLAKGDSIRFRSSFGHRLIGDDVFGAKVLFVACPPSL